MNKTRQAPSARRIIGMVVVLSSSPLAPSSSSSIGRSPRRCCNTNRTIEKPRGVKSYAAGVFFIAAVKQKMKEIYLSKPPVDCCGDGEP